MDKLPESREKRSTTYRKKNTIDLNAMVYGKIPPQAREFEESILGAIMIEKNAYDTVIEIIRYECFYVEAHQKIFKAFQDLAMDNQPIDMLTVIDKLRSKGELEEVGGAYYITKLTNMVTSSAHIETHARIVLQKFIQRELIRICGEIIHDAYEEGTDVFDLLDESETKMFNITNNYLKKNYDDIAEALKKAIERIDKLREQKEEISGVPSGFPSLDKVTYGWQPSDLIILAARPAVGKTAFALNLIRNAALSPTKPTPVAFFSLEMSAAQLVQRLLSAESEIEMGKISRGTLEEHEYQQLHAKGIKRLEKAPIFIDDTAALNIFEFRAKARRLVNKHGVGLIIIDYLQLMSGSGDRNTNREQEISSISRNLKVLAKELNIPIIALSQLSRAVESRKESKVPQLSDLRESGAIEQDADMVMFIYRPDYYDQTQDENGESTVGMTMIKIAKHRNGALEDVKLRAKLEYQSFEEWGDTTDFSRFMQRGENGIPGDVGGANEGGAAFFVKKGSRLNDEDYDDFDTSGLSDPNDKPPFEI